MVERFFAEITRKRIRRGIFKSVDELTQLAQSCPYAVGKSMA
jgi:hypothetical protein